MVVDLFSYVGGPKSAAAFAKHDATTGSSSSPATAATSDPQECASSSTAAGMDHIAFGHA